MTNHPKKTQRVNESFKSTFEKKKTKVYHRCISRVRVSNSRHIKKSNQFMMNETV